MIISKDIQYAFLNQLWRIIAGPLLMLLVPLYLSPVTQGYWFSIISLGALGVFADLGFTTIITQFTAHEIAFLKIESSGEITGADDRIERVSALFSFCILQVKRVCVFVFPVILVINYLILSHKSRNPDWILPWMLYNSGLILFFANNVILAFIEGCNLVALSQKIRVQTSLLSIIITIFLLVSRAGLYSLAIAMLLSSIMCSYLIWQKIRYIIKNFKRSNRAAEWGREIYPLLLRYAGSFVSGYFIFQIFTPLALVHYGPIEAGKVGLSISMWSSLLSLSNVWISVVIPEMNMLIAKRNYSVLNPIFKKVFGRAIITYIIGFTGFIIFYLIIGDQFYLFKRIVSLHSTYFLAAGWFLQLFVNAMAIYIRGHKTEPFLIPSIMGAIHISVFTLLVAKFLSFDYFFVSFLSSYIWGIPWTYKMFYPFFYRNLHDETI